MHVVHIITDLDLGGAEMMLLRLVSATYPQRFTSTVINLSKRGVISPRIEALGVEVHELGLSPGKPDPIRLARLASWLRKLRPDVIQTWMYHADLIGSVAASLARPGRGPIPVVWGIHNSTLDPARSKRSTMQVVRQLARLSWKTPHKIISCSQVARDIHVNSGYAAAKMTVIPNGFDLELYHPQPGGRQDLQDELGLAGPVRLAGVVARYDPQKDYPNFLQAAALVSRQQANVHFVCCGSRVDENNADLLALIRQHGLTGRVHLLGQRDDVPRLAAAFDVLVTASAYGEAFPLVVGEAMACETPCVVTDVGDSGLLVGDTGQVVPPRDPQSLAAGMSAILSLPQDDLQELGRRARRRISAHFSLAQTVQLYEEVYRETLHSAQAG
ncbi:MAG: glycosyltransferase [Anaerolineaceae bacterium]|nr:glycosyltransferase [Anaerolineaceae bacterium]